MREKGENEEVEGRAEFQGVGLSCVRVGTPPIPFFLFICLVT